MNNGIEFAKGLVKVSLYMIVEIILACVCAVVQSLMSVYDGKQAFLKIFTVDYFNYNLFMYILGLVIYFGVSILIFEKLGHVFEYLKELNIIYKVLTMLAFVIWGFAMLMALFWTFLFEILFGLPIILNDNNGVLVELTAYGWPIITVIFLCVMIIIRYRKSV